MLQLLQLKLSIYYYNEHWGCILQEKINVWSFVFSLLCLGFCLLISFTGLTSSVFSTINSFEFLLVLSLVTFLAAVIGLYGIKNWKGLVRSIAAIIITVGLSVFSSVILFYGSLLG